MEQFEMLIYSSALEDVKVEVVLKDETIWATQKAMAQLFGVKVPAINKHINHIFEAGELTRVVISKMETTAPHGAMEGKTQTNDDTMFYNLDMIIAVGYRVSSLKATRFRQWATGVLKEYIQKGFVLDDERMKRGGAIFGKDYFRELLDRVRSIRANERRIWQQITDIYAECSVDYDKDAQVTKDFYSMIQNKFHYAITGQTAAEIVYTKADSTQEHMGLTTWKNSPDGRILKSDVTVAKNYLPEKDIKRLERAVSGYFDYIEDLIENENSFTMTQFASSVNEFLAFRRFQVLPDGRKSAISHKMAVEKAESEYDVFNRHQNIVSDFDRVVGSLLEASGENS